jgi:hypothetical protein
MALNVRSEEDLTSLRTVAASMPGGLILHVSADAVHDVALTNLILQRFLDASGDEAVFHRADCDKATRRTRGSGGLTKSSSTQNVSSESAGSVISPQSASPTSANGIPGTRIGEVAVSDAADATVGALGRAWDTRHSQSAASRSGCGSVAGSSARSSMSDGLYSTERSMDAGIRAFKEQLLATDRLVAVG